jgi:hypothetical protein
MYIFNKVVKMLNRQQTRYLANKVLKILNRQKTSFLTDYKQHNVFKKDKQTANYAKSMDIYNGKTLL